MITFVLGGARSGKSEVAERLAAGAARESGGCVTYLATMRLSDDELTGDRIAAHRARRPADWRTVDAVDDLPAAVRGATGVTLLDSIGPWVADQQGFIVDTAPLCAALRDHGSDIIVVSDEVGLGVVPGTTVGGAFRDALGTVNQRITAVADRVLLVVAGRVLRLDAPPEA